MGGRSAYQPSQNTKIGTGKVLYKVEWFNSLVSWLSWYRLVHFGTVGTVRYILVEVLQIQYGGKML